jgi:hypothetical protein
VEETLAEVVGVMMEEEAHRKEEKDMSDCFSDVPFISLTFSFRNSN